MPGLIPRMIAAVAMLVVAALAQPARGQSAWYEGFEGPEPSWQDAGGNARYRITDHRRTQAEAHTGDGCEQLTVLGDQGTHVYISHQVGRPRVIEELLPTVWVRSDRPGLQLLARVVFPRTEDPRTGRSVSAMVCGSTYRDVGRWQQLRIDDVPQLATRQVRILRSELGSDVDGREAYVDRILLNVYGGPGTTRVWIDDLDVGGYVEAPAGSRRLTPARAQGVGSPAGRPGIDSGGQAAAARRVELAGSVLLVAGRPMFPRIIRHQGEALAFLQRLGFNTVWLDQPASPGLLHEAQRLGLWLVCPPPLPASPYTRDSQVAAPVQIGSEYDSVLAWDLGRDISGNDLDTIRGWSDQVRTADRRLARPRICLPSAQLLEYSRHVDLLLIDRRPLGTSLELADYGRWIFRQPLLARPGTKVWTTVQTQPAAALRQQLAALQPDRPVPLALPSEQVRLLAYTAVAAGSRGLLFESRSPLHAGDPETRQRAMTLELLNLELQLIEPWAAAGNVVTTVEGSRPEVLGSVLRTDRSHLLLPIWSTSGAQCVPGQSAVAALSLVVPGVPESSNAYELQPGGLQPLLHKRVTRGLNVTLDEFGLTSHVVFAQDPLVINSLTQRAAEVAPRAARLYRDLAADKLQTVREIDAQLGGPAALRGRSAAWMQTAWKNLQMCDGAQAAREYRAACTHARRTMQALRLIERAHWEAAVAGLTSPLSSPAAASFATLPWHRGLVERIAVLRPGPNQFAGGDFEDLGTMLRAGWNHFQHASSGLATAADLVSEAAHSGNTGLRLVVRAADPESPPAVVETPPVWITSPGVPVEAGQLVCIRGWVHVPSTITGSVDGLLILDSLSGEPLADRIGRTEGWQPFVLYRAAPQSGRMSVTFALSGLGEVRLDDVTLQPLVAAAPGPLTARH
ncbi:MAG: hypothetical protein JXB62_19495 [Pirellulales bacterium]|nr:hypothetical protein [Pirellulales bacterium]